MATVTSRKDLLSHAQLEQFCHRMSMSLKAGISVADAFESECRLRRGRIRDAFATIAKRLRKGASATQALTKQDCLPAMLVEMVRVGEESGQLDQAFLQLADHYRNLVRMKRTFLQGITWPMLQAVLAVTVISIFFLAMSMLEARFDAVQAPDLFMLGLRPLENLALFWSVLLGGALFLGVTVKGTRAGWFGSLPMRVALGIPLLGSTLRTMALSRFSWAFGAAVDSGMNAQRAIQLGLRSTRNPYYAAQESSVLQAVATGQQFHTALEQTDAFPEEFLHAVQVGEQTGELTESLGRLSDDYREQSSLNLRRISQISGFGIFVGVGTMICFSIMLMWANYLSMMNEAVNAQTATLEQIRAGQKADNPMIAARNEIVKDFVDNNEDFKQFESIYRHLGDYGTMSPDEFLDGLLDSATPSGGRPAQR